MRGPVEILGHDQKLFVLGYASSIGQYENGECLTFEFGRGGAWCIPLAELKAIVAEAESAQAELKVMIAEDDAARVATLTPEPQPRGWLHPGALVVFARPPADSDVGGIWSVRDVGGHPLISLQQGNSYMTAEPSQLAHVHQAGPDIGAEEMARHRVIAVGGKLVKNAYGSLS